MVFIFHANGIYIPLLVIFKENGSDIYKQDLPPGSMVHMSDSGYINADIFLEWLKHFQKYRPSGNCLLIFDGHTSHCSFKCLKYCRENQIEMLCLPPHTTHALQPLDRTIFKPLKCYYHQKRPHNLFTTILNPLLPNFILTSSLLLHGSKRQLLAMLSKDLSVQEFFPL